MSVEFPEARILATQLAESITGKVVESCELKGAEKLQVIGFINKDAREFDSLVGHRVESIDVGGNTIRVGLNGSLSLVIAPEYGGIVRLTKQGTQLPTFHLSVGFNDGETLTVRLTGMGIIRVAQDDKLGEVYVYRRDYLGTPSPGSPGLSREHFIKQLRAKGTQIKPLLVGKDALLVGLSNSAYQDILFRAQVHPRRRASELSEGEAGALFDGIIALISERLQLGGKTGFVDLYGKPGGYVPLMGPNMRGKRCVRCGATVESAALGGGQVFFCPGCQK